MKIKMTTDKKVLHNVITTTGDCINIIKPGVINEEQKHHAVHKLHHDASRRGPGYTACYNYNESDNTCDVQVEIVDELVLMVLPTVVKIAKLASPLIGMFTAAMGLVTGLRAQLKDISNTIKSDIQNGFGRPARYAVMHIRSNELNIDAAATVRDDGFDNIDVIRISVPGESKDLFGAIREMAMKRVASMNVDFCYETEETANMMHGVMLDQIFADQREPEHK